MRSIISGDVLIRSRRGEKENEREIEVDALYAKVKTEIEQRGFTVVQEVDQIPLDDRALRRDS